MFQHVISCAFIACGLCGLWGFRYLESSPFIFLSLQGRHNKVYRPSCEKKYCPTWMFSGFNYKFTLFLSLLFFEGLMRLSLVPINLVCQVVSALCSEEVDREADFKLLFSHFTSRPFYFIGCFETQSYLSCFCTTDCSAGNIQRRLVPSSLLFPRPLVIQGM